MSLSFQGPYRSPYKGDRAYKLLEVHVDTIDITECRGKRNDVVRGFPHSEVFVSFRGYEAWLRNASRDFMLTVNVYEAYITGSFR